MPDKKLCVHVRRLHGLVFYINWYGGTCCYQNTL